MVPCDVFIKWNRFIRNVDDSHMRYNRSHTSYLPKSVSWHDVWPSYGAIDTHTASSCHKNAIFDRSLAKVRAQTMKRQPTGWENWGLLCCVED